MVFIFLKLQFLLWFQVIFSKLEAICPNKTGQSFELKIFHPRFPFPRMTFYRMLTFLENPVTSMILICCEFDTFFIDQLLKLSKILKRNSKGKL